jgi:hypothetical protein
LSICKFKTFSRGYTPGPPLTGEGKRDRGKGKAGKGEGRGWRKIGDEGYGMRRGWDKEEGGREKAGIGVSPRLMKEGSTPLPVFSNTPSFIHSEISQPTSFNSRELEIIDTSRNDT